MGFFSSIGDALGGAIGGIVGGVTGLFGNKQTNSANADINAAQMQLAREQLEYQKELHKNQIQWRVEDAQKAGLHPMAALGLQSSAFSPVSASFTPMQANDYSWIGDIGQNAGYAAMKAKDRKAQAQSMDLLMRQGELQTDNLKLQNDGLKLENEFRRFQLQQAVMGGTLQALRGPPSPSVSSRVSSRRLIDGQGDALVSSGFDEPIKSYGFRLDSDGKPTAVVPSDDYKSRSEDTLGIELLPWLNSIVLDTGAKYLGLNAGDFYWDKDKKKYVKGDGFWRRIDKKVGSFLKKLDDNFWR